MKERNRIQEEVEKALQSLDNVSRAHATPFLFTRIKARMEKEQNRWGKLVGFISRPAFAVAVVFFVLLVNGWILIGGKTGKAETTTGPSAVVTEVPEEYNLAINTFYDYETP